MCTLAAWRFCRSGLKQMPEVHEWAWPVHVKGVVECAWFCLICCQAFFVNVWIVPCLTFLCVQHWTMLMLQSSYKPENAVNWHSFHIITWCGVVCAWLSLCTKQIRWFVQKISILLFVGACLRRVPDDDPFIPILNRVLSIFGLWATWVMQDKINWATTNFSLISSRCDNGLFIFCFTYVSV